MSKKRGQNEGSIFEESPGKWRASISLGWKGGKRIRKTFTAATREEVLGKLDQARENQRKGANIEPRKTTVGQYLDSWLEHTVKPNVRPKTYSSYEQMVRNHLAKTVPPAEWKDKGLDDVDGIGRFKLTKFTVEHMERFVNAKLQAGNSPALVRYLRVVLRVALNLAVARGYVYKNVASMVKPPKGAGRHIVEPFTPEEARVFLAAVQGHRWEALFTVALAVGVRHGEALALQWTPDVDLEQSQLRVFQTLQRVDGRLQRVDTKSADGRRVVPLPDVCVAVLQRHRKYQELERAAAGSQWQETGYVFTTRIGTPLNDRNVLREFYKLLKVANLPRRRFHDLRHACITLLAAQGVPDKTIAELVGHSDTRLTKNVYQHASVQAKRQAVGKMNDILSPPNPVATLVATQTEQKRPN